ncbi:hypothetical protein [Streptomyces sp. AC512_CC834]|uniref:hypothetical protein n=1 Tax=Streptomyces sp. AC512_CC834 TaxID=2823691 RepID=UPI001C26ECDD|nr:hypothetical protein [Streptomyces sp. AC512_CC834]
MPAAVSSPVPAVLVKLDVTFDALHSVRAIVTWLVEAELAASPGEASRSSPPDISQPNDVVTPHTRNWRDPRREPRSLLRAPRSYLPSTPSKI